MLQIWYVNMWKDNWLSNTILENVSEGNIKQEAIKSIIVFHALVHIQLNK